MSGDPVCPELDFKVSVVLPAGGTGQRFECDRPKQYCTLLDKPLILHTITAFHRLPWIDDIVVVVSPEYISYMNEIKHDNTLMKVTVTEGGSTRHRSIYAGIQVLCKEKSPSSVVIIHDAARPFIDEDVIKQVAMSTRTYGAAGVTRPLVSTVISTDEHNLLVQSLDRTKYCGSEMPQGFVLSVIKTAYDKSDDYDFDYGTECLLLAMKYTNTRAKLISGPENLWKVTYKKDLYAADGLLKERLLSTRMKFIQCSHNDAMVAKMKSASLERCIKFMESEDASSVCNSTVCVYTSLKSFTHTDRSSEHTPAYNSTDTGISSEHTPASNDTYRSSELHIPVHSKHMRELIKPCTVHVYDGCEIDRDEMFTFMETVRNLHHNDPDVLTYGVLHFDGDDYTRLSQTVSTLIWNRDTTLSGQTMILWRSDNQPCIK